MMVRFEQCLILVLVMISCNMVSNSQTRTNGNSDASLILQLPSDVDYSRDQLHLSIHLPNKIKPSTEAKALSRKIMRKRFDFDSHPFEMVSKRSRFRSIIAQFARKGVLRSSTDLRSVRDKNIQLLSVQAARIVIKIYEGLRFLRDKQELKTHRIKNQDIKNLKELVDEFQKEIKMFTYEPTLMRKELDQILGTVSKTTGKGSIRVTGIEESDDGTLINLYISRE
jgi:hypothetical protein